MGDRELSAIEPNPPELSVVMPCLNEADTIGTCVDKAQRALAEHGIQGEVIVADNGSSDGSSEIARSKRGFGHALMGGITAARGRYVLMGDADDSYDFLEIPCFLEKLREGCELVQGCRLPSGGGRVLEGAMPGMHRWLGNPLLSWLARWWFRTPIHDVYCGMRGFTRGLYVRLALRCTGMEFATEMIIKACLQGARIAEVPITLHPDGRRQHGPHLRTFRDGWRTLRFFLLLSPRWLFEVPGLILVGLGMLGFALALPGATIHGAVLDAHTLLFASLSLLCGAQALLMGGLTHAFATAEGLLPAEPQLKRLVRYLTLERGVALSFLVLAGGLVLLLAAVRQWWLVHFGPLDYAHTMRLVIPGATAVSLGFQGLLFSFFGSALALQRR
jgi:hypothetical protein